MAVENPAILFARGLRIPGADAVHSRAIRLLKEDGFEVSDHQPNWGKGTFLGEAAAIIGEANRIRESGRKLGIVATSAAGSLAVNVLRELPGVPVVAVASRLNKSAPENFRTVKQIRKEVSPAFADSVCTLESSRIPLTAKIKDRVLSISEKGDDMVDPTMAAMVGAYHEVLNDEVRGHGHGIQTVFELHRGLIVDFIRQKAA